MTETPTQQPTPYPARDAGRRDSRGRRAASAVALVTGGILAGGIMTTAFSAAAQTTEPTPDATSGTVECGPHGAYEPLDGETTARIEEAVAAAYPDATVLRARELTGGGYHVHVETAEDEHLILTLDESFAITDEVTRAEMPAGEGRGFRHGHGPGAWQDGSSTGESEDAETQTSSLRI
jgi:hypothetical protein